MPLDPQPTFFVRSPRRPNVDVRRRTRIFSPIPDQQPPPTPVVARTLRRVNIQPTVPQRRTKINVRTRRSFWSVTTVSSTNAANYFSINTAQMSDIAPQDYFNLSDPSGNLVGEFRVTQVTEPFVGFVQVWFQPNMPGGAGIQAANWTARQTFAQTGLWTPPPISKKSVPKFSALLPRRGRIYPAAPPQQAPPPNPPIVTSTTQQHRNTYPRLLLRRGRRFQVAQRQVPPQIPTATTVQYRFQWTNALLRRGKSVTVIPPQQPVPPWLRLPAAILQHRNLAPRAFLRRGRSVTAIPQQDAPYAEVDMAAGIKPGVPKAFLRRGRIYKLAPPQLNPPILPPTVHSPNARRGFPLTFLRRGRPSVPPRMQEHPVPTVVQRRGSVALRSLIRRGRITFPTQAQDAPKYLVATSGAQRRNQTAVRTLRRGRSFLTPAPQVNPLFPLTITAQRRNNAPRSLLRRAEVFSPVVRVQDIPVPIVRQAPRPSFPRILLRRGKVIATMPTQLNPPYPWNFLTQTAELRTKILRTVPRRTRVTQPVQAQDKPTPYVVARRKWPTAFLRRGHNYYGPLVQVNPPYSPPEIRQRKLAVAVPARKGRTVTVVPAAPEVLIAPRAKTRTPPPPPVQRRVIRPAQVVEGQSHVRPGVTRRRPTIASIQRRRQQIIPTQPSIPIPVLPLFVPRRRTTTLAFRRGHPFAMPIKPVIAPPMAPTNVRPRQYRRFVRAGRLFSPGWGQAVRRMAVVSVSAPMLRWQIKDPQERWTTGDSVTRWKL